jgi:putative aminopeptidase FrvX
MAQRSYKSLADLIAVDSPTGYTDNACRFAYELLESYGWKPRYTNKGAVACSLAAPGTEPTSSIAAHVDTLGAIVSEIRSDGHLHISKLGGLSLNMAEGEYCRIRTLDDKTYQGTILLQNPSVHVNSKSSETKRTIDSVYVRLDEVVAKKEETEALGIRIGDIICLDTRYRELESGYIKSRYLDNKAGCYVLFELAREMAEKGGHAPVELFFSNYEEVGHGASAGYSPSIKEMLVIDMGVVGDGVAGDERACSICAKDSSGPYDYNFRKRLFNISEEKGINCRLDIYPFYGSDGSAALRAGHEFVVGLIGPGVAASHGVERTHKDGVEATIQLCQAYMDTL